MRIKMRISQDRRDFTAIYECEHCGDMHQAYGYDDANFHNNVIPAMQCRACSRVSPAGPSSAPIVPAHVVI